MKFLISKEFIARIVSSCALIICLGGAYLHSVALFSFALIAILLITLFFEWPNLVPTSATRYIFLSLIYPTFPFFCLIYLNYRYHYDCIYLPLYPILIAWTADTFGYLVGKQWGTHKMCPEISPGKTWEGFSGSFIGVVLMNLFLIPKITIAPFSHATYIWYFLGPIKGSILFTTYTLGQTIIAFLGGFFLSILKRKSGLKDAGTVLPGHGGFLDRFDSVLSTTILVWITLFIGYFFH